MPLSVALGQGWRGLAAYDIETSMVLPNITPERVAASLKALREFYPDASEHAARSVLEAGDEAILTPLQREHFARLAERTSQDDYVQG
jgi:hypothetical protein